MLFRSNYSNASGSTAGGTTDSDWASSAGSGGGPGGTGSDGRVVIYMRNVKYTYGYTGSVQTLNIV